MTRPADEKAATSVNFDDKSPGGELVLHVPEGALIPEGATFYDGPDDKRCRLIVNDERCRGTRMRANGLCPGHAGVGGVARRPHETSRLAAQARTDRKRTRLLLGVSARRAAQPLQASRMAAQMRANDFARAIVDDPLDDESLSTIQRQQAAVKAVELLFPQVTATLDVEVPDDAQGVEALDWEQLQQLAGEHLGQGHPGDTPPALNRMVEPSTG